MLYTAALSPSPFLVPCVPSSTDCKVVFSLPHFYEALLCPSDEQFVIFKAICDLCDLILQAKIFIAIYHAGQANV